MNFKQSFPYLAALLLLQNCDTTNSNSKDELKQFIKFDINDETWKIGSRTFEENKVPIASYNSRSKRYYLTISTDTLAPFPYRLGIGFAFYPNDEPKDTAYTFTTKVLSEDHVWVHISESDDNVWISSYEVIPDIDNELTIAYKTTVEGTDYSKAIFI